MTASENPHSAACNICGGRNFKPGPNGRLSAGGVPPACEGCGSLERHRILRQIVEAFRDEAAFKTYHCLQFSKDSSVAPEWFFGFENSFYGGRNSLDVQAIDRPNESVDVVVCNHVLEHVPKPEDGVRELGRITARRGFMLLSYPNPYRYETTTDWGYPKPEQHGHYRIFGRDFEPKMKALLPDYHIVTVTGQDQVTDVCDSAYIITRANLWRDAVLASPSSRLI